MCQKQNSERFYSSINRPFEVRRFLDFTSFKSNTPLQYNLISMLIVFGAGYAADKKIGVYVLCSVLAFIMYLYYRQVVLGRMAKSETNIFNAV